MPNSPFPGWGGSGGSSGDGILDGIRDAAQRGTNAITSWGELSLPGWAENLKSVSGTLYEFGSNPRGFILGVLALWLVNGVLGFVETVLGLLLSAWALVAGIPGTVASSLTAAGSLAGQPVLGIIGTISDLGLNLIAGTGWLAPIVLALLFVALLEASEEIGWAVLPALSDLLGAIPVVGSILDAVVTFLINLAGGRS